MPEVLTFPSAAETHEALAAYLFEGVNAFHEFVPDVHIGLTRDADSAQSALSLLRLLTQHGLNGRVHLWWPGELFVALDDERRGDKYIAELVQEFRLGSLVECHRAPAPTAESSETVLQEWQQILAKTEFSFAVVGVSAEHEVTAHQIVARSANIAVVGTGQLLASTVDGLLTGSLSGPLQDLMLLEQTSLWVDDDATQRETQKN